MSELVKETISESIQDATLASPLAFKSGLVTKNRFFKSAMSENLGNIVHDPTPNLEQLYRTWALGGVGIQVSGNVMVDRSALGEPNNVVMDTQSDLVAFRRWAEAGKTNGTKFVMQLNHPGKQSPKALSATPVAPSAIGLQGLEASFNKPRALESNEILDIIKSFAVAAKLAKYCGFDGVQIHAAHGYLVSQFLSPRHNQREDDWGGSPEKRSRFLLAIIDEIRAQAGADFSVGVKLNSADFKKGGIDEEESSALIKRLDKSAVDYIEVSGGSYESPAMMRKPKQSSIEREAYFLAFAEKLKREISTPLVVTGGFRSAAAMMDALASKGTDLIGLARPFSIYPTLPNLALTVPNFVAKLKPVTLGIKALDKSAMVELYWHEMQLERLALGKPPAPKASAWRAFWFMLRRAGILSFGKKRRA